MVVSNRLVYGVDTCLAVKDQSTASISHDTFSGATYGLRLYQKYSTPVAGGGGRITAAQDNIIWGNSTNPSIATNSDMVALYSDVGGPNFPSAGNISEDPFFLNAAARDYRLAPNSPAGSAGSAGCDMGPHFPVGAPMTLSHPRIESETISNGVATARFWVDSEKSCTLQIGDEVSGGTWTTVTNVPTRALPVLVEVDAPLVIPGHQFFRLQTPGGSHSATAEGAGWRARRRPRRTSAKNWSRKFRRGTHRQPPAT